MRSTLFYIPHADPLWDIPLFGFGWALMLVGLIAAGVIAYRVRQAGWKLSALNDLPVLLVLAGAAVWLAPALEESAGPGVVLGVPIRAYGVMVLLGIVAGIAITAQLAREVGVHSDLVVSLAFWMILAGFPGARAFYVIEYWDQFARPTWSETLVRIVNLTDGGLVVYGSFITAVIAFLVFVHRHRLPALVMADVFAPGMMLGLALGRIGCLMNGCCWGGECGDSPLGITFPQGSPPFMRQLESGALLGVATETQKNGSRRVVRHVEPGSQGHAMGLREGDVIDSIFFPPEPYFNQMRSGQAVPNAPLIFEMADGRTLEMAFGDLPTRSRPVYPTQILSALNAALICWVLWVYFPFRSRNGQVAAWMLTVYPVSRILIEMIRDDESGLLPTEQKLTISQTVSCLLLLAVVALWWYVRSQPRRAQPAAPETTRGSGSP